MSYQTVIGLEIHLELGTKTKMFCRCRADHFAKKPNSQTCPVCLGLPGALPYPNQKAIEETIRLGLALDCEIPLNAKFDRKHYFYPDLPKGYQISQYDQPFCKNGVLMIVDKNGQSKKIRINRVHLEEDAGKLMHRGQRTLVDFNRAGVPLVEIVSEPDLAGPEEAERYAKEIQQLARWLGISTADMEKGQLRLELNLSLRPTGTKRLPGYRVEVKNINSFRFLKKAILFEVERQAKLLDHGKIPDQETRGYNAAKGITFVQRSKEEAHDYRYFPEPDIPPFQWTVAQVKKWQNSLPALPREAKAKLIKMGVKKEDAETLSQTPVSAEASIKAIHFATSKSISAQQVANLLVNKPKSRKLPFEKIVELLRKPTGVQEDVLQTAITTVLRDHPQEVDRYQGGKKELINFFIGKIMAATKGQASPADAKRQLIGALEKK